MLLYGVTHYYGEKTPIIVIVPRRLYPFYNFAYLLFHFIFKLPSSSRSPICLILTLTVLIQSRHYLNDTAASVSYCVRLCPVFG
jgi:hypothetical protein